MSTERLAYYHALGPFAGWFKTGVPVLTYHKLGPRPAGTRLKGLYLGERLFARQLAELRKHGYRTRPLDRVCQPQTVGNPGIALTFDDGFENVLTHGLEPLARHGFQATQFLVADRLGGNNNWDAGEAVEPLMHPGQVREWLAAGHKIGSHTLSHPWLTRIPPARAREEISASKKKLEDIFGVGIDCFCYPYGDWNETVRNLVQEAGYRAACTVDYGINTETTPPLAIQRITARYPSRNLKAIAARLRLWLKGGG